MEVVLLFSDKIPSWNRSGFSPCRCEKRFFSAYSDITLNAKVLKSALLAHVYLIADGIHRFLTGVSTGSYSCHAKEYVIGLTPLLWDQKYKRAYISIRRWDPGVTR